MRLKHSWIILKELDTEEMVRRQSEAEIRHEVVLKASQGGDVGGQQERRWSYRWRRCRQCRSSSRKGCQRYKGCWSAKAQGGDSHTQLQASSGSRGEWAGSAWELGSFSVAAFTSGLKSCTHPTGNPKQYQQYHLTLGEQKRNYCKGS